MTTWLAVVLVLFVMAMVHAFALEGWRRKVAENVRDPENVTATGVLVSMIVSARNAASTLAPLLQDLHAQRYPKEYCEVIVVDDGSEDGTADVVLSMMRTWPQLRLISPSDGQGKKNAITKGVLQAKGELILLTDADARCGPGRLAALVEHWRATLSDLVVMPVHTAGGAGVVAWLQQEEQLAFQGATAGSTMDEAPLLANGANLAFTRAAFMAVDGFHGDRRASGDDMMLLKRMLRAQRPVSYLLNADTIATVAPEPDWNGFLLQRLRWAGKMHAYHNTAGFFAGLFAVLFPWALLTLTVLVARNVSLGQSLMYTWTLLLGAWMLWAFPIIRLVRAMKKFFGSGDRAAGSKDAFSTLLALAAFMVYAPFIAVLSLFVRPMWKGRRI